MGLGLLLTLPAAPLLAGVLADLMAVRVIKDTNPWRVYTFLATRAGWKRPGGQYAIWNGVGKADNPPNPLMVVNGSTRFAVDETTA